MPALLTAPVQGGGGEGSAADPSTAIHLTSAASLLGVPEEVSFTRLLNISHLKGGIPAVVDLIVR